MGLQSFVAIRRRLLLKGRGSSRTWIISLKVYMSREHTRHLDRRSEVMVFWSSRMASKADAIRPTKILLSTKFHSMKKTARG